jgi:hypothetical protein
MEFSSSKCISLILSSSSGFSCDTETLTKLLSSLKTLLNSSIIYKYILDPEPGDLLFLMILKSSLPGFLGMFL